MRTLVTGAAGFIGSHLVDRLLADGDEVVGYDNLSTGQLEFLAAARGSRRFRLVKGDIADRELLIAALRDVDRVFHLAANADVRRGADAPTRDLEQNTIGTSHVLEAMRAAGVGRIIFASTASVYGEASVVPTPEDAPFPVQTSLYGASKLAAEGLIAAYAAAFGFAATILRFVSFLGRRYTHGHVFDFVQRLTADPTRLDILGDGTQRKSYLHVEDGVAAIVLAAAHAQAGVTVLNVGADATCTVAESAAKIAGRMGLAPHFAFGTGPRGWVGDAPLIQLDCTRLRALGWAPTRSIPDALADTVDYLLAHPEVMARRAAVGAER